MPIAKNQVVLCKDCGKKLKIIRSGDVLTPKEAEELYYSYCTICKLKKVFSKKK